MPLRHPGDLLSGTASAEEGRDLQGRWASVGALGVGVTEDVHLKPPGRRGEEWNLEHSIQEEPAQHSVELGLCGAAETGGPTRVISAGGARRDEGAQVSARSSPRRHQHAAGERASGEGPRESEGRPSTQVPRAEPSGVEENRGQSQG